MLGGQEGSNDSKVVIVSSRSVAMTTAACTEYVRTDDVITFRQH